MVRTNACEQCCAARIFGRAQNLDLAISAGDLDRTGGRDDRASDRHPAWTVIQDDKRGVRVIGELKKIEGNFVRFCGHEAIFRLDNLMIYH